MVNIWIKCSISQYMQYYWLYVLNSWLFYYSHPVQLLQTELLQIFIEIKQLWIICKIKTQSAIGRLINNITRRKYTISIKSQIKSKIISNTIYVSLKTPGAYGFIFNNIALRQYTISKYSTDYSGTAIIPFNCSAVLRLIWRAYSPRCICKLNLRLFFNFGFYLQLYSKSLNTNMD